MPSDEVARRETIRRRFASLPTAIVCDVYDELEREPAALATDLTHYAGEGAFAGWAVPLAGQFTPERGGDTKKLEAVDALQPGSVTVWAGSDARGICLFGDGIASIMQRRGSIGAVVDGGIRDVAGLRAMGFPVVARYASPVQSVHRWRVTRVDEPVVVRGHSENG